MHWIVKLNFLVVALGLVIYSMYTLRHRGLNPELATALGLQQAKVARVARIVREGSGSDKVTWCETRVTGLIRPEKLKLTQIADDWVVEAPTPRKVDFISVEKWFSSHCSVRDAAVAKADPSVPLRPLLVVKFVNGKVGVLKGDEHGLFDWGGHQFASADLLGALSELEQLPDSLRK